MVEGSIGIRYPIYQTKLIKRQQYKLKEIPVQDACDIQNQPYRVDTHS